MTDDSFFSAHTILSVARCSCCSSILACKKPKRDFIIYIFIYIIYNIYKYINNNTFFPQWHVFPMNCNNCNAQHLPVFCLCFPILVCVHRNAIKQTVICHNCHTYLPKYVCCINKKCKLNSLPFLFVPNSVFPSHLYILLRKLSLSSAKTLTLPWIKSFFALSKL